MYERISEIAGTWGLVLLLVLFAAAVLYALWPANRDKFERASHLPLMDDDLGEETRK